MSTRLKELERLLSIVDRLRAEDGCPWDLEQTLESMAPCAQEEAAEVADAVVSGRPDLVCEELGDLLMNVVLMSRIAEQDGTFSLEDVAREISAKLVRRHPHVFGSTEVKDSDEVLRNWEQIKQEEKAGPEARKSLLDGIPTQVSSLLRVHKLASRVARVGFDWPGPEGAWEKVTEELAEVLRERRPGAAEPGSPARARIEEEIGDLLFATVCAARLEDVDADLALRRASQRFERRFRYIEERLGERLGEAPLDEMEALWSKAKAEGL